MNKTWIIMYRKPAKAGRQQHGWSYYTEIKISRQQAAHEMQRQAEKDTGGNEWALFELVDAFAVKVQVDRVVLREPDAVPEVGLQPPPPMPAQWFNPEPALVIDDENHEDLL